MPLTSTLEQTPPPLPGKTVDNTLPTVGGNLAVVTDSETSSGFSLSWTKGSDNQTAEENLKYLVYISDQDNITGVTNAENNGTLLNPDEEDQLDRNTYQVTGQNPETQYWSTVILKDQDGNKSAYGVVTTTTAAAGTGSLDSRAGDEAFMQALYDSAGGDSWDDNTGWNDGNMSLADNPYGLTIETVGGELRITEIDLFQNNLVGTLPSEIGNLKELTILKLKQSLTPAEADLATRPEKLTGEIPPELGVLTKLTWLSLGGQPCDIELRDLAWNEENHCSGTGSKAYMEGNKFSGELPSELGNLVNLEMMEIRRQELTGSIPSSFGNLTSLIGLFLNGIDSLSGNALSGQIPTEIGDIGTSLKHLHLNRNQFTGDIPASLNNLTNLKSLRIGNNQGFSAGSIPTLDNVTDMVVFRIQRTNRTGDFPDYMFLNGNNTQFDNFSIEVNDITGQLPTGVDASAYWSLTVLGMNSAGLTGPIPNWITGLQIKHMNLGWNGFSGDLPAGYHDDDAEIWNQCRNIRLTENDLTGPLPSANFGPDIYLIHLNGNNFDGNIPANWGNITSDRSLDFRLENNNISGYDQGAISPVVFSGGSYVSGLKRPSNIDLSFNDLTQQAIDDLIVDLWANVDSREGTEFENNGTLTVTDQSTGAVPSSGVSQEITNLENAGWTINHD